MTDEMLRVEEVRALLAAVRMDPKDDTARLVMADWIQEHVSDSDELQKLWRGGAKHWLGDFCFEYDLHIEDILEEATAMSRRDPDAWDAHYFLFYGGSSSSAAHDIQENPGQAKMFWDCLEVMTGYVFPAVTRGVTDYSCRC